MTSHVAVSNIHVPFLSAGHREITIEPANSTESLITDAKEYDTPRSFSTLNRKKSLLWN